MTTQSDEALDKRVRAIVEAVDECRRALIDLVVEDKVVVIERLTAWVEYERRPPGATN